MSVQVSYKKQFVLGIILLIIFAITVEGIIRIYDYSLPPCEWLDYDAFEDHQNTEQICIDVKKLEYEYFDTHKRVEPNQHFDTINVNNFGFRGPEITKIKSEEIYRIFIVGGSTAFGVGSTDEATISSFLQKKFDMLSLEQRIEVINAGVGGSFSYEENNLIKEYLLQFEPDLIIGYDGGNDARYRIINESTTYETDVSIGFFKLSDLKNYRTPFFLNTIMNSPISINLNEEHNEVIADNWERRWMEICELGNSNGFSTLVTVQPTILTIKKELSSDEKQFIKNNPIEKTTEIILESMSKSLPLLKQKCTQTEDLRGVFDDISGPIFFDDIHITDKGNKIIAEKIYEKSLAIVIKDIKK
jgi:lysophospholipase L1-like esterase